LTTSPYSLNTGDGVYVKISATNAKGTSATSSEGNGGLIIEAPDAPINLAEDVSERTSTNLGFTWSAGSSNGGSVVIDYRINQRVQAGSWSVIATGITLSSYTATSLTLGTNYEFTVEARNQFGYSSISSTFSILHAIAPSQPTAPTTSVSGSNIVISWNLPTENGSSVTSYLVTIRQSDDSTFTEDSTNCDGSNGTILTNRQCTVPITTLITSPYSLNTCDGVYVKISATNAKGTSSTSNEGNGGQIISAPDAPVSLTENDSERTSTNLGFTWSAGSSNGGSVVIDYRIN
jgi:hypothetical protein